MRYRRQVRSPWLGVIGATAALALTAACGHVEMPGPDALVLDGSVADAPADAPTPPMVVAAPRDHNTNASTLQVTLTVMPGTARYLLVALEIGSMCGDAGVATVTSVSYGGVALERVAQIVGTACSQTATRSEQWGLVAPAVGTGDVVVMLSDKVASLHVAALLFTGISQTMPVRASQTGSGRSNSASVSVASAVGDLVVSTVGNGDEVVAAGGGQDTVFILPGSGNNTLDNSGASTKPGASPMVAMDWKFNIADEWQMIVSSLRPQ